MVGLDPMPVSAGSKSMKSPRERATNATNQIRSLIETASSNHRCKVLILYAAQPPLLYPKHDFIVPEAFDRAIDKPVKSKLSKIGVDCEVRHYDAYTVVKCRWKATCVII